MRNKIINALKRPIEIFLKTEASSGIILAVSAFIAIVIANSNLSAAYFSFLSTHISFLSIQDWINDGLMAIFFFVVGLEIKREIVIGELSTIKKATLPVAAAIGGMIVPALFYTYFNHDGPFMHGWAIPMATDIAFAVGVLSLFGRRVPLSLKIFLLALAIVDDLGAVIVIALFYTEQIRLAGLLLAGCAVAAVVVSQRFKRDQIWLYLFFGVLTWIGLFYSGVHATISGVIMGLLTPVQFENSKQLVSRPIDMIIAKLHPLVSYFIMPLFAFANAGIAFGTHSLSEVFSNRISIGIATGLFLGKPIGVFLTSRLVVLGRLAVLPKDLKWMHVAAASVLAGIGFTMSIFISNLALTATDISFAKIAILSASFLSAVLGYLMLSSI